MFSQDSNYYLQKGKECLDLAYQQQQNENFDEAKRLFVEAQETFNKILPAERTPAINQNLAQFYLTHGDRLRDLGYIEEANASYEIAHTFDSHIAHEALSRVSKFFFKCNPQLAGNYEPVENPRDIKDIHQLALCLRSVQLKSSVKQELNDLAYSVLQKFSRHKDKDLSLWREIIPLASTQDPAQCRFLLDEIYKVLADQESVLYLPALQSLAILVHNLPESSLKSTSGHLVKVLKVLIKNLECEHSKSNVEKIQLLLQATSQILDEIAKAAITGILYAQVQKPLDKILSDLTHVPELQFQAYYARQALAHIPKDDNRWRELWSQGPSVILGAPTVANVLLRSDLNETLETFDYFSEVFSGSEETANRLAELSIDMKGFDPGGAKINLATPGGVTKTRQQQWYAALQFLDICLEEGQFVQFELFARHSIYTHNAAFLLGLCQRLEQIARMHPDTEVQKGAKQFLENLLQDKAHWGGHKHIIQIAQAALLRLEKPLPVGSQCYLPVWSCFWQEPLGTQLLDEVRKGGHEQMSVVPPFWGKVESTVALQRGEHYLKAAREHRDKQEFDLALNQFNLAKSELKKAAPTNQAIEAAIATVYLERGDLHQERGRLSMREDLACAHTLFKRAHASYKKATIEPYNARETEAREKIAELKLPETPSSWRAALRVNEAIKQRFSSQPHSITSFFKQVQNSPKPSHGQVYPPVTELAQLIDTRHLAWCLQEGYLSEAQEKQFKQLARDILEAFSRTQTKGYFDLIREIVPFAAIADPELYQQLLSQTVNALSANQSILLDVSVAQGLVVIIRDRPTDLLNQVHSGDLVDVLKLFRERLDKVHKENNLLECQTLLCMASQLLDAMTYLGVSGIDREGVQAPLYATLDGLIGHSEPELAWQARYARQALVHIPNNEAVWECILRHTFNIGTGVLNIASAIKNLDVEKLESSLSRFEEAFIGVREIAMTLAQLGDAAKITVEALQKEYESVSSGLQQLNRPQGWYAALRFADLLLEENQFVALEKLARTPRYSHNEKFLQGLCQRLERVARTSEGEVQKEAKQFLESLAQDQQWGGHERVTQMAQVTLQRLDQPQPVGGQDYIPAWFPLWREPLGTQLLDEVRENARQKQVPVKLEGISQMLEYLPGLEQKMQDILEKQMQQTQSVLEQKMQQILSILEQQQAQEPLPDLASLTTLPTDLKEQKEQYLKSLEETGEIKGALAMYKAMHGQAASVGNKYFGLDDIATVFFVSNERVRQISEQLAEMKHSILPQLFELEMRQRTQLPPEENEETSVQITGWVGNILMGGSDNTSVVHFNPEALDL
ncbi:hypothetical protein [Mycoavidus cysteinexigens]|uniref:hypothetical protein n=1 Tax=Mycoavidus cysteinexigens TaxID=1553431 RepID=UPI000F821A9F|nr:hypothetical protein [Mycoavidus cysteinexigens]